MSRLSRHLARLRCGRRLLRALIALAAACLLWAVSLAVWPPPDPYEVKPPGVRLLDRQGRLLRGYLSADQMRRWRVPLDEISPLLVKVVLEQEDRRFRRHPGVDALAVARAVRDNLGAGRITSGASTLTMQLVRLTEPRRRSVGYKLYQMWRALQYEALYSKDEILERYLNLAPYGGNIEGVAAAAQIYFGKTAGELSLAEACLLAVLPQSPATRRPVDHGPAAIAARDALIDRLEQRGEIDTAAAVAARGEPLPVRLQPAPFVAPHFCDWVRRRHPTDTTLHTTLEAHLQQHAERLVADQVRSLRTVGIDQAAAVILDSESSEILALVGSAGFADDAHAGQVNGATARRSPGSTLKPFVYALAFERGLTTPAAMLPDVPLVFADYTPRNYDDRFRGVIRAGDALQQSLNIPVVGLAAELTTGGGGGLYDFLQDAGVESLDRPAGHYGLALVLGGGDVTLLELASLYATLARQGLYRPLRELVSGSGIDPATTETIGPSLAERRVLDPAAAWLTLQELTGVARPEAEALWTRRRDGAEVAWKTGTSYGHRDAWSVGVVGRYVVAVWVGNFTGRASPHLVGSRVAAPLLFAIVETLPMTEPATWPIRPSGLARRRVCALSGAPAGPHCGETREASYLPGVSPAAVCEVHRVVQVDEQTGCSVCSRCRRTGRWREQVVEWWPPEIATHLVAQDLVVQPVPQHDPTCPVFGRDDRPVIVHPAADSRYHLRRGVPVADQSIALQATCGAGNRRLYWFVDGQHLATAAAGETVFLTPTPGRHRVSVVDEAGQTASTVIWIAS